MHTCSKCNYRISLTHFQSMHGPISFLDDLYNYSHCAAPQIGQLCSLVDLCKYSPLVYPDHCLSLVCKQGDYILCSQNYNYQSVRQ